MPKQYTTPAYPERPTNVFINPPPNQNPLIGIQQGDTLANVRDCLGLLGDLSLYGEKQFTEESARGFFQLMRCLNEALCFELNCREEWEARAGLLADLLSDALSPLEARIEIARVFGSVASSKATNTSDIDLLIVGNLSYAEVVKALYATQDRLGREINPKLYSPAEWQAAKTENSAFIRGILEKPTIHII